MRHQMLFSWTRLATLTTTEWPFLCAFPGLQNFKIPCHKKRKKNLSAFFRILIPNCISQSRYAVAAITIDYNSIAVTSFLNQNAGGIMFTRINF